MKRSFRFRICIALAAIAWLISPAFTQEESATLEGLDAYILEVMEAWRLPGLAQPFKASILGAVLTGIGLALLVERLRSQHGTPGLGLSGAIAINICGAGVLAIWLLAGNLNIPARSRIFLWVVAVVVLGTSIVELLALCKRKVAEEDT